MHPRNIRIADYNYCLPEERIAKFPIAERDHSKLLVYRHGEVGEDHFYNLPQYIAEGSLMVFNNTKVIQARIHFRKSPTLPIVGAGLAPARNSSGARIEVFLLEPSNPTDYELMFQSRGRCSWHCLVGNLKKWKEGPLTRDIIVGGKQVRFTAENVGAGRVPARNTADNEIEFTWDNPDISFAEMLDVVGELPIPPYLNRETQESDLTTYQTVYSKIKGSVAAPTAGLHFTDKVLEALDAKGIDREELTLHVGAGTFKPVKSEEVGGHEMHTETFCVKRQTIDKLIAHGGKATAVGTTSVRTLESLYYIGLKLIGNPNLRPDELHVGQWEPYCLNEELRMKNAEGVDEVNEECRGGSCTRPNAITALRALGDWMDKNHLDALHSSTQIIIAPGYKYKIVDKLITNFHQPQSTLLLLVSALVGEDWRTIYDYALSHDFRFLSYGDSSILIP